MNKKPMHRNKLTKNDTETIFRTQLEANHPDLEGLRSESQCPYHSRASFTSRNSESDRYRNPTSCPSSGSRGTQRQARLPTYTLMEQDMMTVRTEQPPAPPEFSQSPSLPRGRLAFDAPVPRS